MGEEYYPVPWSVLTYNERFGGYEVYLTKQQLEGAPHYDEHQNWNWEDQSQTSSVNSYYGQRASMYAGAR